MKRRVKLVCSDGDETTATVWAGNWGNVCVKKILYTEYYIKRLEDKLEGGRDQLHTCQKERDDVIEKLHELEQKYKKLLPLNTYEIVYKDNTMEKVKAHSLEAGGLDITFRRNGECAFYSIDNANIHSIKKLLDE